MAIWKGIFFLLQTGPPNFSSNNISFSEPTITLISETVGTTMIYQIYPTFVPIKGPFWSSLITWSSNLPLSLLQLFLQSAIARLQNPEASSTSLFPTGTPSPLPLSNPLLAGYYIFVYLDILISTSSWYDPPVPHIYTNIMNHMHHSQCKFKTSAPTCSYIYITHHPIQLIVYMFMLHKRFLQQLFSLSCLHFN